MRSQFNYDERLWHLIAFGAKGAMSCLISSGAVAEKEKVKLKAAIKNIDDFTALTVERMGKAYENKLQGTANVNEVRVVGKTQPYKDCVSYCDVEDMKAGLSEVESILCWGCQKEDHKCCGIYRMLTSCDVLGFNSGADGCPYKVDDCVE